MRKLTRNYSKRMRPNKAFSFCMIFMRYHYDKKDFYIGDEKFCLGLSGQTHTCNHPVYSRCTLYFSGERGLAVIQQRYDPDTKATYWTEVDGWLVDTLYLHPRFPDYFEKRAGMPQKDIYPTVTLRQIMWALKMKPLKREPWETAFDHCPI